MDNKPNDNTFELLRKMAAVQCRSERLTLIITLVTLVMAAALIFGLLFLVPKLSAVLSLMCAKRPEDRMASPKEVIDAFARLGYALRQSGETEFAAEDDRASSGMVQDLIPDVSAQKPKPGDDFRLDTQDAEIRDFVSGLRKKRRRQTVAWLVFAASIIFFLAALAWRLCR